MENVIKKLFFSFCTDEDKPYLKMPLDDKEYELREKVEDMLSEEQRLIFEEFVDICKLNWEQRGMKCFELGIKLGIKLASGSVESINVQNQKSKPRACFFKIAINYAFTTITVIFAVSSAEILTDTG